MGNGNRVSFSFNLDFENLDMLVWVLGNLVVSDLKVLILLLYFWSLEFM